MNTERKPILDVLQRRKPEKVPFWLMRQAGRYLPEYLELRAQAGSFLNLVYDPEKASEVTVQPLRRFGMDAAILFSDILIVPQALGQTLTFEAGEGPRLDPVRSEKDLAALKLDRVTKNCALVYETVSRTRQKLKQEGFSTAALIGFCGSPWTVACYMVQGSGSKDFAIVKRWAKEDPAAFQNLIDLLVDASILYLDGQIRAGAEVIQLFESWAGLVEGEDFDRWVVEPTHRIRQKLQDLHPAIPVIGFPRGAMAQTAIYAQRTGIDCVGLCPSVDPSWAAVQIQPHLPVQGNLEPEILLQGGSALDTALENLHRSLANGGWIFNLGHGVIKETPIAHIERLAQTVQGWKL